MLSGRQVKLRSWRDDDLGFLHELRNDPNTQLALMGDVRPQTVTDVRRWLEARTAERDQLFFIIESLADSTAIGFVELRSLRPTHGHAALGIYLAPSARGRGCASEAMGLITRYGLDVFALRKLYLHVLDGHERAIRLYERAGFQRIGMHRAHFYFAGKYHDVLIMEKMLSDESQRATAPWTQ